MGQLLPTLCLLEQRSGPVCCLFIDLFNYLFISGCLAELLCAIASLAQPGAVFGPGAGLLGSVILPAWGGDGGQTLSGGFLKSLGHVLLNPDRWWAGEFAKKGLAHTQPAKALGRAWLVAIGFMFPGLMVIFVPTSVSIWQNVSRETRAWPQLESNFVRKISGGLTSWTPAPGSPGHDQTAPGSTGPGVKVLAGF